MNPTHRILRDNGIARLVRRSNGDFAVSIPGVAMLYVGTSLATAMAHYRDASN